METLPMPWATPFTFYRQICIISTKQLSIYLQSQKTFLKTSYVGVRSVEVKAGSVHADNDEDLIIRRLMMVVMLKVGMMGQPL